MFSVERRAVPLITIDISWWLWQDGLVVPVLKFTDA
jgi:hypothetical protein